jgi:hypothetical protein
LTLRKRSRTTNLDPPTALLARPDRFRSRFVDHERHPGITSDIPDLLRLVQPRAANFDAAGNGVDYQRHRMDLGCAARADARQRSDDGHTKRWFVEYETGPVVAPLQAQQSEQTARMTVSRISRRTSPSPVSAGSSSDL